MFSLLSNLSKQEEDFSPANGHDQRQGPLDFVLGCSWIRVEGPTGLRLEMRWELQPSHRPAVG
jgi:hypothetical protein